MIRILLLCFVVSLGVANAQSTTTSKDVNNKVTLKPSTNKKALYVKTKKSGTSPTVFNKNNHTLYVVQISSHVKDDTNRKLFHAKSKLY